MNTARYFQVLLLAVFGLFGQSVFADETDDYTPEVTARVARISFLRGDVKIRRADSQDWERAVQNLPLVEGDQIATDYNARVEIQFDRDSFLRVAENSYLKIPTLRDEGIALSLPQGTLSLRVLNFDKSRGYFEIDAPQTTLSVQKTGLYRIDAGEENSNEIRVTATDGGEARVYSDNSGFTLRNGRSSRIYLNGNYAGEWETSDASRYADNWDEWVLERDAKVAQKLRNAYYDRYYDRDIYGAEDLNEHGEWIQTRKYGWVWKPYRNSTSSYADWSPYRYGHWRWVPPYGWTWVNDEPWGWATYHHGRWIYNDNGWVWSPYGYYRPRRSWWNPALVVVTYSGNLICWYPLSYNDRYYNYNRNYYSRRRNNNTTIINNNTTVNNTTVIVNQNQTPRVNTDRMFRTLRQNGTGNSDVPPNGVVAINRELFGIVKTGKQIAPRDVAIKVLTRNPDNDEPPVLPVGRELRSRDKDEIAVEKPRNERLNSPVKIGVIERQAGTPSDTQIRRTKVFDERNPIFTRNNRNEETPVKPSPETRTERDTGAIERIPTRSVIRKERNDGGSNTNDSEPVKPPRREPRERNTNEESQPVKPPREEPPIIQPKRRKDDDESSPPRIRPREEPRETPRETPRENPRNDPSPKPREEKPPRIETPRKSEPEVKVPNKGDKDN